MYWCNDVCIKCSKREDLERVESAYVENVRIGSATLIKSVMNENTSIQTHAQTIKSFGTICPNRLSKLSPTASDSIILTSITRGVCGFTR
jgi:hypothetical protein